MDGPVDVPFPSPGTVLRSGGLSQNQVHHVVIKEKEEEVYWCLVLHVGNNTRRGTEWRRLHVQFCVLL